MTGWIESALGSVRPDASIGSVTRPAEGNRKETAIVTLADGERLVVQRSADPEPFAAETLLLCAIADRTTVPVPAVVDSGRLGGHAYRVTAWIDGGNLHRRFVSLAPGDRERIARRFGSALAELHRAFEFDRFGPLVAEDGRLRATGPTAVEGWFRARADRAIDALPDAFSDLEARIRDAVREPFPSGPTPLIFAWDLRPGNAIVDGGSIAAFPDWGEPLAGPPGLAVAKVEHLVADWYRLDREPLRSAFRGGYAEAGPLPDVRRADRVLAVVDAAVDSDGIVTRPGFPELTGDDAVAFHRERLHELL